MRISLRPSLLAAGSYTVLGLAALAAQEPEPAPAPPPTAEPPAPTAAEGGDAQDPEPTKPAKPPMLVVEAGTVHPVAGPSLQNGVVLIDGDRIVAVGRKGDVEVPADAVVRSFPTGHVYPGLVDAATDAFTDAALRAEGGVDAGTALADVLQPRHDREDELVAAGITTAYVTVRSPGVVRPQGAIVRPTANGFEPWTGRERAAVQLRMTNGPGPTHALQRQQMLQQVDALFEGLEEYKKAFADHEEALKKYAKEFEDYLAWHKKKKDEKAGDKPGEKKDETKPAAPPADAPPTPPEGRRRVRPGGGGGGGGEPPKAPGAADVDDEAFAAALGLVLEAIAQDPPRQDPGKQDPKPAPQGPPAGAAAGDKPAEAKDEAPKRPTWPKAPARDPQKDALQRVLDGALPLRVEVHRADEVRAALQMQQKRKIPVLVLEQAYGAGECAAQLGERGTTTVLTDLLPADMPEPYDGFDPAALAGKLQAAGVPFAIATGSARRAPLLAMMAAAAVGRGLHRDAALRAITLTPAEILGVATEVGSLQKGKLADVLVCDRPLFTSDSHVLLVLQKGRTAFETK